MIVVVAELARTCSKVSLNFDGDFTLWRHGQDGALEQKISNGRLIINLAVCTGLFSCEVGKTHISFKILVTYLKLR